MHNSSLRLKLVTAPERLPVTLDEAKAQLRLTDEDTTIDALIQGWIAGATEFCQKYTGRQLITATYDLFLDEWPYQARNDYYWEGWRQGAERDLIAPVRELEMPRPPLQSVTQISTFDDSDNETVYSSSNYYVDDATEPGRVVLRRSVAAPVADRVANGIKITFVAGYGAKFADVPQPIRDGILRSVGWMEEHRGDDCTPEMAARSVGAEALWQPYRIMRL